MVNYSSLTEDRGVFNEYPKGTNVVHFVVNYAHPNGCELAVATV